MDGEYTSSDVDSVSILWCSDAATTSDTCAIEVHIDRLDMQHSILSRGTKCPASIITVLTISFDPHFQAIKVVITHVQEFHIQAPAVLGTNLVKVCKSFPST